MYDLVKLTPIDEVAPAIMFVEIPTLKGSDNNRQIYADEEYSKEKGHIRRIFGQ
jgi:hypothetical protein